MNTAQQHRELVAPQSRDRVGATSRGEQARGDFDQQRVARGVAVRVVHALEVVEVDVEHGERGAPAWIRGRAREPFAKAQAVRQSGERVVSRVVHELLFDALAVGDVGLRTRHADDGAARVRHPDTAEMHPSVRSAAVRDAVLELEETVRW